MSPEPVTVKVPPACRYPDSDPVVYGGAAPAADEGAAPSGAGPAARQADMVEGGRGIGRVTGSGSAGDLLADLPGVARRGGEQPGLHRGRQPGQVHGADLRPPAAVGRVVAGQDVTGAGQPQPARCRRGDAAGQPGPVTGVVPLHPGAMAASDHDRRVGRSLAGAGRDEEAGLRPRREARRQVGRSLRGQARLDDAGERGRPDGDAAVCRQRAVHEVIGVGDGLAARAGRDDVMARSAGAALLAVDRGEQAEQHGEQHRGDDGDDPAADRPELDPLSPQQVREAVAAIAAGRRGRLGRGQLEGGHRAASAAGSARYSTASRVSSM